MHHLPALYTYQLRMNHRLIPDALRPIAEKIESQERISDADAMALYRSSDLNALGMMANFVRERKNGNYASYIHNRYINYSNICVLSCQFCAFAARKRDPHAFEYAIEEIVRVVKEALPLGITEVHMVGGLHPTLKKDWYLDLLRELRALDPDLHIKAFTAIEVRHLAQRIFRLSIREMLELLREHGLGSITGGGAESLSRGCGRGSRFACDFLRHRRTVGVCRRHVSHWWVCLAPRDVSLRCLFRGRSIRSPPRRWRHRPHLHAYFSERGHDDLDVANHGRAVASDQLQRFFRAHDHVRPRDRE